MKRNLILSTLLVTGLASASPAVFCKDGVHSGNAPIDLVLVGCVSGDGDYGWDGFYSNAGGGDSEEAVEQAILHATGVGVDLTLYGKSDEDPSFFTFGPDADPAGTSDGTWAVDDGTVIAYFTVKAANSFALYQLLTPSASGVYTTDGLLTNKGREPGVSHMSFWTARGPDGDDDEPPCETPEPGTWATLAAGLGVVAWRRKSRQ